MAIEKCFYPQSDLNQGFEKFSSVHFDQNHGFEKFSSIHFDLNRGFDFKILTAFIRLGRAGPVGAGCPPYYYFYYLTFYYLTLTLTGRPPTGSDRPRLTPYSKSPVR